MKKILLVSTLAGLLLSACTISMTMVHTQGSASDVVDEEQSPVNDVKPNLSVPASLIP